MKTLCFLRAEKGTQLTVLSHIANIMVTGRGLTAKLIDFILLVSLNLKQVIGRSVWLILRQFDVGGAYKNFYAFQQQKKISENCRQLPADKRLSEMKTSRDVTNKSP